VLRNSAGLHLPGHGKGDKADLDLIIAAGPDGVVMMEGTADQVGDIDIVIALESARGALEQALTEIDALRTEAGRAKRSYDAPPDYTPLANALGQSLSAALQTALAEPDKHARRASLQQLRADAIAEHGSDASPAFDHAMQQHLRAAALEGRRIGGRALDEVRPIECEAGLLPANHGSALFTRGETQVLVSATLGSHRDARDQERLTGGTKERFMLHYNFPSFSVGEARAHRGPGRRELGHGRLAHRALASVMPDNAQFPYTVRVVSDVTESNGSSSMATVCGATLAMANAGVPLVAPVAGIAMGLLRTADRWVVLTDILGDEDHLGDMDFKVAGTETGITTLQLDNKLGVLPTSVLAEALAAAASARRHILSEMRAVLEAQSGQPSEAAPQHARVKINPSRIGALIGTAGRNLQQLQNKTKAKIEVNQDGTVLIFGRDAKSTAAAIKAIEQIDAELKKGGLYLGTVVSMKDFGAFVRIGELEALVHVSELDTQRVTDPKTVVSIGDEVLVKVLGTDSRGRVKLSRKAALGSDKADAINT
jgi:polyribonucleotide nucleotidyltransferase